MFDRRKEFIKDLDWGNFGEGVMINYIQETFKTKDKFVSYWYSSNDMTSNKSIMKSYDLRFGTYLNTDRINYISQFDVEIKCDGYEIDTGNLIFEKSCGKKKSGVFATKSKYFIYFLPLFKKDNVYRIKSNDLIELLGNFNEYIVSGGDKGSSTFMYRINRDDFNEKFIQVGGKIDTYDKYVIPEKFEKKQFEKKNYTYYSDTMKKYDNPLN